MPSGGPAFEGYELAEAYEEGQHAANLAQPTAACPYFYGECLPLRCQWLAGYHDQKNALLGAMRA